MMRIAHEQATKMSRSLSQHSPGTKERDQYRQERMCAEGNAYKVFQTSLNNEFTVNFCDEKQGTKVHKEDIDVGNLL